MGLTGRLFAWSSMVSIAAGLRWGDLLNTATATTVLMQEGLIGFAVKTKTMGKYEGRPCGASRYAFSNGKWLRDGFGLFRNDSGDLSRDFWIGRPLTIESELGFPNQDPAFWSCSRKVMTCLLFQADHPEGHGVRPNSLKVTTISTLATAVAKGNANLSQLAIRGN